MPSFRSPRTTVIPRAMTFLLAAIIAFPAGSFSQDSSGTKSPPQNSSGNSRTIYIAAKSKDGGLADLQPADLLIEEEKRPVHIDSVSCKPEPLLIGILIDTSGSRRADPNLASHYDAIKTFLAQTMTPRDGAYIVTFGDRPRVATNVTSDLSVLSAALDQIKAVLPVGPTAVYDAIYSAAKANFFDRQGHRIIIVVGDFEDNVSRNSLRMAEDAALTMRSSVYALVDALDTPNSSKRGPHLALRAAQEFSSETGGAAFLVEGQKQFADTLREISGALKSFCRVDYAPAPPRATKGQSVKVTVKILKQNISIQAPSRASLSAP
jgi:VWFA-related protein